MNGETANPRSGGHRAAAQQSSAVQPISQTTMNHVLDQLLAALNLWPVINLDRRDGYDHLAHKLAAVVCRLLAEQQEGIAQDLEQIEEFCKDYFWECGEVLIPRDVAVSVARGWEK